VLFVRRKRVPYDDLAILLHQIVYVTGMIYKIYIDRKSSVPAMN
jgi:hypothetical protein